MKLITFPFDKNVNKKLVAVKILSLFCMFRNYPDLLLLMTDNFDSSRASEIAKRCY